MISHYSFLNQLFANNALLSLTQARRVGLIFLSLFIVGYGQPARFVWLCPIAAVIGFAIYFAAVLPVQSRKKIFFLSTFWFAAVQMIQLSWMTSIEFQGYYIIAVYLTLCLIIGVQFGVFTLLIPRKAFGLLHACALAGLWTVFEWARLYLICGFSWNPTGVILAYHEIPMQFASLFGVYGLSFWIMLTNLWAANVYRNNLKAIWLLLFLIFLPYAYGIVHLNYHALKMRPSDKRLHVALVQTGLLPSEKMSLPARRGVFIPPVIQWEKILDYLQKEKQVEWDLIVLPEAALPHYADTAAYPYEIASALLERKFGSEVRRYFPPLIFPFAQKRMVYNQEVFCVSNLFFSKCIANLFNAEVLIGLDHFERSGEKSYNSAFFLTPQTETLQRYDKRILLPLAEYLPFDWMRPLTKSYGIYDFFSKGEYSQSLGAKIPLSVSICYEETFAGVIRENTKKGSSLLINITNDNYYPNSLLPEQHFFHARLRAVENGLPLARACNTGVTAVIDSLGRILARFGEKGEKAEFKQGVLQCSFVPYKYFTPFTLWGNAGVITISFSLIFFSWFLKSKIMLKEKFYLS